MSETHEPIWIPVPSGIPFDLLRPEKENFLITDIAHKLAMQARYGGGLKDFYSVAEHCWLLSFFVPPAYALDALMHDRAEAYFQDIIRPVKMRYCQPWYGKIELTLEKVSAGTFGLRFPTPQVVLDADFRICKDEKMQGTTGIYSRTNSNDHEGMGPLGATLRFWSPAVAKRKFLDRYLELTA